MCKVLLSKKQPFMPPSFFINDDDSSSSMADTVPGSSAVEPQWLHLTIELGSPEVYRPNHDEIWAFGRYKTQYRWREYLQLPKGLVEAIESLVTILNAEEVWYQWEGGSFVHVYAKNCSTSLLQDLDSLLDVIVEEMESCMPSVAA